MGKYYRSSRSIPVDYMFNLNIPLMEKVLQANDAGITNVLQQADTDKQAAYFDYMPKDEAGAKEIMKGYEGEIDTITNALRGNYADWRSQGQRLSNLTNKLASDYKTGKIAGYMSNAKAWKDYVTQGDAMSKLFNESKVGDEKGLPQDYVNAFRRKAYNDFQGSYDKEGSFTPFSGGDIPRYHNISKEVEVGMDKVLADEGYTLTRMPDGNSMYMREDKHTWKGVNPEKLLSSMEANITPEMMDYLYKLSSVGIIPKESISGPIFTKVKDNINPTEQKTLDAMQATINSAKKDSKNFSKDQIVAMEKKLEETKTALSNNEVRLWNPKSYLAGIMTGLIERYTGGNKDERETTYSGDPVALKKYEVANTNANAAADRSLKIQKMNDDNYWEGKKYEQKQREIDNELITKSGYGQGGVGGSKSAGGVGGVGVKTFPTKSQASSSQSKDYMGREVSPGVPYLSRNGLLSTISSGIKERGDYVNQYNTARDLLHSTNDPTTQMAARQSMKVASDGMARVDQDLSSARSTLNMAKGLIMKNQTQTAGIEKFEKGDADFYDNLSKNGQAGYKELLKQKQNMVVKGTTGKHPYSTELRAMKPGEDNLDAINLKIQRYEMLDNKLTRNLNTLLDNARNKTDIKSDAVTPDAVDSYYGVRAIEADPYGNTLRNVLTTQAIDVTEKISGTDYNLSLTGENNLFDYMRSKPGVEMYIDRVKQHGLTNNGGPVGEISFRDPNGGLAGRRFLVDLNPSVTNLLGVRFHNSDDANVSKMGSTILNPTRTKIIQQVESLINFGPEGVSGQPGAARSSKPIMAPVPSNKNDPDSPTGYVPVNITATPDFNGGQMFFVTIQREDGTTQPLPKLRKDANGRIVEYGNSPTELGSFDSADQIAETLDLNEQRMRLAASKK